MVGETLGSQASLEIYFLGTVSNHKFDAHMPMVNILKNDVNLKFRIDIGAEVTVLPYDILELLNGVNIMPSS